MEELVSRAVKFVDAFTGIFAGMGVNDIQQHRDAHLVGSVDQFLQFLRHAEPGRSGKEIGNLVAKGCIVRMLHDSHDLNGVVTQILDAGQRVLTELIEGADFALLLRHTDVALIDEEILFGLEVGIRPVEGRHFVDRGTPGGGAGVLDDTGGIQGDAIQLLAVMYHNGHDALAFFQGILTGQEQLKNAILLALHRMGVTIPTAEVTGQVHSFGGRGPFPIDPATFYLMETIVKMTVCKIRKRSVNRQISLLFLEIAHAHLNIGLKGLQIRIQLCDLKRHC